MCIYIVACLFGIQLSDRVSVSVHACMCVNVSVSVYMCTLLPPMRVGMCVCEHVLV